MATHTLNVPFWRPPSLNMTRGRHWKVEYRLKRKLAERLRLEALAQGVPDAAGPRLLALTIALPPRGRRMDYDNHLKLTLDALVTARLLLDDGAAGLPAPPAVGYTRGAAGAWGTTLTLVDVEALP